MIKSEATYFFCLWCNRWIAEAFQQLLVMCTAPLPCAFQRFVSWVCLKLPLLHLDSLIEQTGGFHLNQFWLRPCCLLTTKQCVLGMLFSRENNLVSTPVGLSVVSMYWGIMELCIRNIALMKKQWLLSTQQSTQSLLLTLHQHPLLSVTNCGDFFLCALLCAMWIKLKKCNGCNF